MRHTFNSQHLLVSRVTLYLPAELGIVMRAEIVINNNNDRSSESHGWWRLHYFKFWLNWVKCENDLNLVCFLVISYHS